MYFISNSYLKKLYILTSVTYLYFDMFIYKSGQTCHLKFLTQNDQVHTQT